ncbi:hypothetical protein Pelo_10648 [Pelomyxa schiedti]|nr:hypothetical protein Pelo_10648 [Pelomyxa schiedti]
MAASSPSSQSQSQSSLVSPTPTAAAAAPPVPAPTVTKHVKISGRVQGVSYRASMQWVAQSKGVAGWVRNCADGSVEAVVQGDDAAVAAVLAWARDGPRCASVDGVAVLRDQVGQGEAFRTFSIRDDDEW